MKKQKQPQKSLMEPVTGKWVKAESQALNWSYKLKPGPNIDIPADAPAEAYLSWDPVPATFCRHVLLKQNKSFGDPSRQQLTVDHCNDNNSHDQVFFLPVSVAQLPLEILVDWCEQCRRGTVTAFQCEPSGEKPLDDYVKYMRGVDRGDQLITLYNGGSLHLPVRSSSHTT